MRSAASTLRSGLGLLLGVTLLASPVFAREVQDLATIQREVAVAEDVITSAMRRSLRETLRLSNVESDYLAGQGALITMDVTASWVSVDRHDSDLHISADIESLADIPEMVQEIIEQLDIAVTPYAPEELEGLRQLRDEQRELRDERREIFSELRRERRALIRAEDEEREQIETVISGLEEQLRVIEEAEAQIDEDIDEQYEMLREVRSHSDSQSSSAASRMALREAAADAVCNFGSSLKTLDGREHLTLKVKKPEETRYFTFTMNDVRTCQRGDIDPGELLERSFSY